MIKQKAHCVPLDLTCYAAGEKVGLQNRLTVCSPYDGRVVGTVALANGQDVEAAVCRALAGGEDLTRFQRSEVLERARRLLEAIHNGKKSCDGVS